MYPILEGLREEVTRCMKCGNCQAVCPVFRELRDESLVARGRIRLVKALLDGGIDFSEAFSQKIAQCLYCKACVTECPSGVKVDKVVLGARAEKVNLKGLEIFKRLLELSTFRTRFFSDCLNKFVAALQRLSFIYSSRSPTRFLLSLFGMPKERLLPVFSLRPFLETVPEVMTTRNRKWKVAYFAGCAVNLFMPELGEAALRVLERNHCEIIIPKRQKCCGMPVMTAGDREEAKRLACENVNILAELDVEAIITTCASCGLTLKREWKEWLEDEPLYREKVDKISAKVYDISEFLVRVMTLEEVKKGRLELKATYHDPCHLNHGLNLRQAPRTIIRSIPGVKFVEMPEADKCCGGGGTFNLFYYPISQKIRNRKLEAIKSVEPDLVLTGCPVCILHLRDGLLQANMKVKVLHTVQLLDIAESGFSQKT